MLTFKKDKNMNNKFKKIKEKVKHKFEKEYICHLRIVYNIAIELHKKYGGNSHAIKIASIAHDIGRNKKDNNNHAENGVKEFEKLAKELKLSSKISEIVARCILMHNKKSGFKNIEEKIISNADALSKIIGHQEFMLMCKKNNYYDKALWGLKHLEKNYQKITFTEEKRKYSPLYKDLKKRYDDIIKEKK